MPKWQLVDSQSIDAIAYNDSKNILYIRFKKNQDVYEYFNVPRTIFEAFLSAPSKGRYFKYSIDGKFQYQQVN